MITRNQKGFTIVELVIVIAVVGILAGILIPTFSNLVKKANKSADLQTIKNINDKISIQLSSKGLTKYETCFDALECVEYSTTMLTPKSKYSIAWEKTSGLFVLLDENTNTVIYSIDENNSEEHTILNEDRINYFIVRNDIEEDTYTSTNDYSIYCGSSFNAKFIKLNGISYDAGNQTNSESVEYTNTTGTIKNNIIRTNGGILTINSETDTVTHYGFSTMCNVLDVSVGTYNEKGIVGRLIYSDNDGKIKFCNGSVVCCYMNTSNDLEANVSNTNKEENAVVYNQSNSLVDITTCTNHKDDYTLITINNIEYIICKQCGGFTKYVDGDQVVLDETNSNKICEIPLSTEDGKNFSYESPLHQHKYSSEWTYNEINHWHAATCKHEEELVDFGIHDNNGKDGCCSVCGRKPTKEITVSSNNQKDLVTAINVIDEGGIIKVTTPITLTTDIMVNKSITIEGKQNIINSDYIKASSPTRRVDEIDESYTTKIFIFKETDVETFTEFFYSISNENKYYIYLDKNIYLTGIGNISLSEYSIYNEAFFDLSGHILYLNDKEIIIEESPYVDWNICDSSYNYDDTKDQLYNRENMGAIWSNNTLMKVYSGADIKILGGYYHVKGENFTYTDHSSICFFNGLVDSKCENWSVNLGYDKVGDEAGYQEGLLFAGCNFYNCYPDEQYILEGRKLSEDKRKLILDGDNGCLVVCVNSSYGIKGYQTIQEIYNERENDNNSDIVLLDNIEESFNIGNYFVCDIYFNDIFLNGYNLNATAIKNDKSLLIDIAANENEIVNICCSPYISLSNYICGSIKNNCFIYVEK